MSERIWDKFLTERDKAVFKASGFGATGGFGKRPALLVIDVSWSFAGDDPDEPILDAIKKWPTACGAESWDAVAVIDEVAGAFRAKKLPVIYTTGQTRADNWDSGSWAWKNKRNGEAPPKPVAGIDPNGIVTAIAPHPQDVVVYKQKPSGFFGTNLAAYLTLLGADSVVVCGTTTSGCVRATVLDAFSLNYRIAVMEDGCFDRAEASHAINLCDMHAKYADVVPGAEIISYVRGLEDGLFPNLPKGPEGQQQPALRIVAAE